MLSSNALGMRVSFTNPYWLVRTYSISTSLDGQSHEKNSTAKFFQSDITHLSCHPCRLGTSKRFQNGSVGRTTGEISNCQSRFFYSSPDHKLSLFFRSRIFLDLLSVLVIDGFRVPLLLRFFFSTRFKRERAWSANSLKDFFPVWVVIDCVY